MTYKVSIYSHKQWLKDLSHIHPKTQAKILNQLEALANDPWPPNLQIRKLKSYPVADFRLRIGNYRVLFDRDEDTKTIQLYRVLERGKLY